MTVVKMGSLTSRDIYTCQTVERSRLAVCRGRKNAGFASRKNWNARRVKETSVSSFSNPSFLARQSPYFFSTAILANVRRKQRIELKPAPLAYELLALLASSSSSAAELCLIFFLQLPDSTCRDQAFLSPPFSYRSGFTEKENRENRWSRSDLSDGNAAYRKAGPPVCNFDKTNKTVRPEFI